MIDSCSDMCSSSLGITLINVVQLSAGGWHVPTVVGLLQKAALFSETNQKQFIYGVFPWPSLYGVFPWHSWYGVFPWPSLYGVFPWHSWYGVFPWPSLYGVFPWHSWYGVFPWHITGMECSLGLACMECSLGIAGMECSLGI